MKHNRHIKIAIAENCEIIRLGITHILNSLHEMNWTIVEIPNPSLLKQFLIIHSPDILIINPEFIIGDHSVQQYEGCKILLTSHPVCQEIGGQYTTQISIYDSTDEIVHKIKKAIHLENDPNKKTIEISEREKEIVVGIAKGKSNKEIANELFLSVHTIITHRRNITRKLDIHSSAGLAVYAIANHLISLKEVSEK